uniref:Sulfatase-modifying factor enzyme-like domain-containing protein n=1 Tax=mine drainage metagenome TaxID=410659 RepID=E6QTP6_9ZZZZ
MRFVHEMDAASLRQAQQEAAHAAGVSVYFSDTLLADGSKGPEMAVIPAGWFEIGSPATEVGHDVNEAPQFRVQVTHAFAIGRFTVTAEQWEKFAQATGFRSLRELIRPKGREPIVNVRTADVERYLAWLIRETGKSYRLPTEAEWEYAARSGSSGPFHFGDTVSCKEVPFKPMFPLPNAKRSWSFFPQCASLNWAVEVGGKPSNLWGLHDVHGNVWELTTTPWHPDHTHTPRDAHDVPARGKNERIVTKGGSWFDPAAVSRSAARWPRLRDELDVNLGFRLVREL